MCGLVGAGCDAPPAHPCTSAAATDPPLNEIVREFLVESQENLAQLHIDLVTLDKEPGERETISRVFRTLHSTAGFLGLAGLQAVSHAGENLLSRLRAGELAFTPEMISARLGVVDAIPEMLAAIEATGTEGGDYTVLIQNLDRGVTAVHMTAQGREALDRPDANGAGPSSPPCTSRT